MSISSLGNLVSGLAPFAVVQQGTITKVAATPLVVPCVGIEATDIVLLTCATKTASTANAGGVEVITIQAGVSFTATSADAVFAGSYDYVVLRSTALVVNTP
jgi:hypothetical protein